MAFESRGTGEEEILHPSFFALGGGIEMGVGFLSRYRYRYRFQFLFKFKFMCMFGFKPISDELGGRAFRLGGRLVLGVRIV